jgi:hypothetical protein
VIQAARGPMRQLASGAWVLELTIDAPPADLLLAPVGAAVSVALQSQAVAPLPAPPPAPPVAPVQSIGAAGAGEGTTFGANGRALSAAEQATVAYVMALVAMPPFQIYAAERLGVMDSPDALETAKQWLMQNCPQDILCTDGVAALRRLEADFQRWAEGRFRLTMHAALPA